MWSFPFRRHRPCNAHLIITAQRTLNQIYFSKCIKLMYTRQERASEEMEMWNEINIDLIKQIYYAYGKIRKAMRK